MKSIIQIVQDVIVIGDDIDSSIIEVRKTDCNFEPSLGDKVNVFNSEKKLIVTKIEESKLRTNNSFPDPLTSNLQDRININIVNDNSQRNDLASYPNLQRNVVIKTTYLILAFFLGGLGGHKFYAGKTGLGILYLVFCWTYIPSFIALIEFVIGCFKKPDAHGRIVV